MEEVRLEATPALAKVVELLERVPPSGITLAGFLAGLSAALDQTQLQALAKTLISLLRVGALRSSTEFPEQEDPIGHALALLDRAGGPVAPEVPEALRRVQLHAVEYGAEQDPDARAALVGAIGADIRAVADATGRTLSDDIVRPLLHEDCQAVASADMAEHALGEVGDDLRRLLAITPLFDMNAGLQCWLASNFVERFGADGACRDPRGFLLEQMQRIDGGVIAPWTISQIGKDEPLGAELKRLKAEFYDHVVDRFAPDGVASLDIGLVEDLAARIPEEVARRPKSHCFFGQFFTGPSGRRCFALNQILSGNSQLFARFLSGGGEDRAEVAAYLREASRHGHFLDMSGVFGFNANLYPPIGDDDLALAPYPQNRSDARRHELDLLELRYDAETHRIYLADADGRPADIYYLGLLNPGLMPQLHRIVCGLSTQAPVFFSELSIAMKRHGLKASGESFATPRVMLGSVALQRRAWNVASSALPQLGKLGQAETFLAVREWRKRHGLPRRGFIRFAPSGAQLKVAGTDESDFDWASFDRTKLKPVYIDFANPLLVRQFAKSCNASHFDASFQEPLPDIDDQNVVVAGQGHVAELQIELSAVPAW
jgi:hypothetical protein